MNWYLFALVSALFSSAASVFEKKSLFNLTAIEFSFFVSFFIFLLSIPFFFTINYQSIDFVLITVLLIKTALASVSFLLVMSGIRKLELSGALPLMVLTPGLVAFFAWILLGQKLTAMQLFGMFLLLAGIVVLQQSNSNKGKITFQEFIKSTEHRYMIAALALYTITSLLDKSLLSTYKFPLDQNMGFQHAFQCLMFTPLFFIGSRTSKAFTTFYRIWWIIILAAACTVIYRYTQFSALQDDPVALVISIKRVSVFLAVLMEVIYLKNIISLNVLWPH